MPSTLPLVNIRFDPYFLKKFDGFVNSVDGKKEKRYQSRNKAIIYLIKTHPDFQKFLKTIK